MSEEILINVTPQETRVAVVENGVLQEVHVERARSKGLVGNIYKGKVVRILPGMQAAFVDIGLERTAFLHAADVYVDSSQRINADRHDKHESPPDKAAIDAPPNHANGTESVPEIQTLLIDGQDVVVQVLKDPIGTKGARLTTEITVAARHLVLLPESDRIGISQRIQASEERERLKACVEQAMQEADVTGGFIVRTVADGTSTAELVADMKFLQRMWSRVCERVASTPAVAMIHEDISLAMRTIRDLGSTRVEKVRIDSRETYDKAINFVTDLIPELVDRIEYYPGERPLFDLYSVEDEMQRSLEHQVPLKSGGYLVIDQTEAMTTVDVNTGAFVGRRTLEETLFKTNLEAAQVIARQLRLRNLGGIIIIDFIDMTDPEHRRQVMRALEKALARDPIKTFVTEMSSLGLVEITRKRTRESLERALTEACPVCEGRGVLKTAETVCFEIMREVLRFVRQYDADAVLVLASQVVVDRLLDEESTSLADLQEFIGKPIRLQVESQYHQELYDIVPG